MATSPTGFSVGDLPGLLPSWARHLRAENKSPQTTTENRTDPLRTRSVEVEVSYAAASPNSSTGSAGRFAVVRSKASMLTWAPATEMVILGSAQSLVLAQDRQLVLRREAGVRVVVGEDLGPPRRERLAEGADLLDVIGRAPGGRRRAGLAAGSSPTTPSWARASKAADVMVIGLRDPVLALRDSRLQQVSHVSLTDREPMMERSGFCVERAERSSDGFFAEYIARAI